MADCKACGKKLGFLRLGMEGYAINVTLKKKGVR